VPGSDDELVQYGTILPGRWCPTLGYPTCSRGDWPGIPNVQKAVKLARTARTQLFNPHSECMPKPKGNQTPPSKTTPKGTPPNPPKTRQPRPYRGRPAKGYDAEAGRWARK
jgi:hypothetical protein